MAAAHAKLTPVRLIHVSRGRLHMHASLENHGPICYDFSIAYARAQSQGFSSRRWKSITMPVLLDGTSVVIRIDAISERYAGFWPRFLEDAPNRTICNDGELARVGFMDSRDAAAYLAVLVARGLVSESGGQAVDCAIVEQATGCELPCPWLERSTVELEGNQIPVGRLVGGNATRIAAPDGWDPGSVLRTDLQIPIAEVEEQLEYLRSEGMVDVYRHRVTGKVLYAGRTTNQGRVPPERLPHGWRYALGGLVNALKWLRR